MTAIGIDIGGTGIKAGRLDRQDRVAASMERPTPAQGDDRELIQALTQLLAALDPSAGEAGSPCPVGIGFAGAVDPVRGIVRRSPHLPLLDGVELRTRLADAWRRPVLVWNDANAAFFGEHRLGAARGFRNAIFLALGTGVGGAILMDGRIWNGSHGFAGEIGHMPLDLNGPRCDCGARGCLEAVVAQQAIVRRYRERFAPGRAPAVATPLEIAARAGSGDRDADEALDQTGRYLGSALVGLAHLFDPEGFVIGGGILGAADRILPPAVAVLRDDCLWSGDDLPVVRAAALGPGAGWIGAALAAREGAGAP